jgi:hypothetical protein
VFSSQIKTTDSYGIGIAGGAAYVFKSIGFFQALFEAGFIPEQYVGTSMGSIVCFYAAAGYEPVEIYNIFKEINFEDFFDLSFPINGGFVNHNKFIDLVKLTTEIENFEDFIVPVKFGIQNLSNFSGEYWDEGNALEALKASIAMEVFFEPFFKEDSYYADIGISDLFIRNPEELFDTEKYFLLRYYPKSNHDPERNFKNIINVIYAIVDIGSYITNALYSESMLNYHDIFEVKILGDIDPKTFYNSLELYEEGYNEGLEFLKNNDIFEKNKINQKSFEFKKIDYEKLYLSLITESYYSPREFYYTFKIRPELNNYLFDFFMYFEYLNNRMDLGFNIDYNMEINPYINIKNFYFPFKFNRINFYYDFSNSYEINLRTYLLEKFRNILLLDLGYNKLQEKIFFNLNLVYDNTLVNNFNEKGIKITSNNYFSSENFDLDFNIKKLTKINKISLNNVIGYSKNNEFDKLSPNIIRNDFKDKIYLTNNIKYDLLNNLNIEISQIIFLNKIFANLEFNLFLDDYKNFNYSYGMNLEFPFSFFGVSSMNIKVGINKNEAWSSYFLVNN